MIQYTFSLFVSQVIKLSHHLSEGVLLDTFVVTRDGDT